MAKAHFLADTDRIGSLLILLFSIFYLRYIYEIPIDTTQVNEFFTARTLPKGLAFVALTLSFIQIVLPSDQNEKNSIFEAVKDFRWKPALLIILLMLAYSLSFTFLGFVISTIGFLFFGFLILGEKRYWLAGIVACSLVLFMWTLLTQVFGLFLDVGDLYRIVIGSQP